MKQLIVGLLTLLLATCGDTAPAFAEPTVVLKVYPKLLPPQPGEVIVRVVPEVDTSRIV